MLTVALIEAAEGVLAQDAVAGHLQVDITRRGNFHFVAVFVGDAVEDHVGIHQVVGDLRGSGKDFAETGEELFLVRRQSVGLRAEQPFHRVGVVVHRLVVTDGLQGLLGKGEQLRTDEGRLRHGLDILAVDAHIERLGIFRAGVFGTAQVRVAEEVREEQVERGVGLKTGVDSGGVREFAGKGGHVGDTRIELPEIFFKSLIGGIERREIPAVLLVDLVAFFEWARHISYSCLIKSLFYYIAFRKKIKMHIDFLSQYIYNLYIRQRRRAVLL